MAPDRGMHVDQKWMDLVPGLFGEVFIMREPGYNVAYWNLHSRTVDLLNGRVRVNGKPCYFFHFSGFDPLNISMVSKHQNRFTLGDLGQARACLNNTGTSFWPMATNRPKNGPMPSAFSITEQKFPISRGSCIMRLELNERNLATHFLQRLLRASLVGSMSRLREIRAKIITRLWYEIYYKQPDVQQVFPTFSVIIGKDFFNGSQPAGKRSTKLTSGCCPSGLASPLAIQNRDRWRHYLYVTSYRPLSSHSSQD